MNVQARSTRLHDLNSSRHNLSINSLAIVEGDFFGVWVSCCVHPSNRRSRHGGTMQHVLDGLTGNRHGVFSSFGKMCDIGCLDIFWYLLPDLDGKTLRCDVLLLLVCLLGGVSIEFGVVVIWSGSFVQSSRPRCAKKLLTVRRQETGVFRHSMNQFDRPNVILWLLLLFDWRRDVDPFRAPLPNRQACNCQICARYDCRESITFKVIVFSVAASISAPSLFKVVRKCHTDHSRSTYSRSHDSGGAKACYNSCAKLKAKRNNFHRAKPQKLLDSSRKGCDAGTRSKFQDTVASVTRG